MQRGGDTPTPTDLFGPFLIHSVSHPCNGAGTPRLRSASSILSHIHVTGRTPRLPRTFSVRIIHSVSHPFYGAGTPRLPRPFRSVSSRLTSMLRGGDTPTPRGPFRSVSSTLFPIFSDTNTLERFPGRILRRISPGMRCTPVLQSFLYIDSCATVIILLPARRED